MGFLWFKSWLEKLLDALEEDGATTLFLLEPEDKERLKSLTKADCDLVLTRLERLSRSAPEEESYSDPFGVLAGLLDEEGSPTDLDRVDALLQAIPEDQEDRRAELYRILGRLQTRDSLDRLMRHVENRSNDPALKDIWSALITTKRDPKYQGVLFPRLTVLLKRKDCTVAVLEIANAFKEPPHPLKDHGPLLMDLLLQSDDEDVCSAAAWTLGLIGHREAAEALVKAAAGEGRRLPVEAAQALIRLGDARGAELIADLCRNPILRWRAREYLTELGKIDLIPVELRRPEIEAEDRLRSWLEHPNEFGKPPEEVALLDASRRVWPVQGPTDCWLFRYRYEVKWNVGIVGPTVFCLFSQELDGRPIEEIYKAYEKWHADPGRGAAAFKKAAEQVIDGAENDNS